MLYVFIIYKKLKLNLRQNINNEKIIIFIMITAVFVGIYNTLNSWLILKNKEYTNELKEERIALTEKLAAESNHQYFVVSKVLPLLKFLCDNDDADLLGIQQDYLKYYDLDLSIYLFDKNGILEKTAPEKAPNQWLIKNLFPYLKENDIEKISYGSRQLDKKIEFSFGYGKNLVSIKDNPEKIINSVNSDKECFFTWTDRENKGVLIFGNRLPDKTKVINLALNKIINTKNLVYAGKLQLNPQTEQEIISDKANKLISQQSLDYGFYDNKEWYFVTDKEGNRYYTSFKILSNVYSRGITFLKVLLILLIILTLFLTSVSNKIILSLKNVVILLFFASSIIPLATISSINLENIETYSDIYKNELKTAMEAIINKLIQNFDSYKDSCSDKLNDLTSPDNNIYDIKDMEKEVTEEFPNSKFTARNAGCEVIYSNIPAYSSGQEALFKSLGRKFIEKYRPSRLNEKEYKGNIFSDGIVSKDDIGFGIITNYPNKLQPFYNSTFKILLFIKTLPKEAGESALLFIFVNLSNIINDYIKSIDPRTLVFNQQQINLIAFNPLDFKWIISPQNNNIQFLDQVKSTYVLGKPTQRHFKLNNENIYSFCVSNYQSNDVCYLGFIPLNKLESDIIKRKFYISISAIIALILFVTIISWLTGQLILPLSDLEKGIKALENHNYEARINVPPGKDELVHLFKEFNYMMGENYDMQLAKNVQEGLITQDFPKANGYIIYGKSFPANKLCGDCLTSYELNDGKILFLIGDLTGNNIGAALMMAFVRSITFNWSQTKELNPASLAEAIDQILRDNQMKRMFIGLICGIFDPINRKINFVTRGHIYPLFIRNDGTYEWIGQPSLPLGIGKKQGTVLQETELLPGERMFCFTSGLIEIKCNGGMTIDYDEIANWALKTSETNYNEDWLNIIKNSFDNWCIQNNSLQTDDLTLFTIISEKSEEQKSYE